MKLLKKTIIQQYHASSKAAKDYANKSINEAHGMLARDYQGMTATNARLARKVHNGPNVPMNGRRLYNITLKQKRI